MWEASEKALKDADWTGCSGKNPEVRFKTKSFGINLVINLLCELGESLSLCTSICLHVKWDCLAAYLLLSYPNLGLYGFSLGCQVPRNNHRGMKRVCAVQKMKLCYFLFLYHPVNLKSFSISLLYSDSSTLIYSLQYIHSLLLLCWDIMYLL